VTDLGSGIDELEVNFLGLPRLGGWEDGLSESDWSLLGTSNTTLDEDVVVVDNTVVWETTEWGDVLLNGIGLSSGVVGNSVDGSSTDLEDLLVELSSGVVTHLTAAGNSPLNGRWMPGTDTSDLTDTSMGLVLETLALESGDNTLGSVTAGDSDGIDALVLLEDLRDLDFLLELAVSPLDLLGDGTSVNLDLKDVSLLLAKVELGDLGGADNTDDRAVLLDALKISLDGFLGTILVLVGVLGESLLLGDVPVLVESSLDIVIELLGVDGGESAEASWGLDVTNDTNNLHWWALNDGGGVNPVSLDEFLTLTALDGLDNVGHTGLVGHEGGEVWGFRGIVLGEALDLASVVLRALPGQEAQIAVTRSFKLAVRHVCFTRLDVESK